MSDRVSGMKEMKFTKTVAGADGKLRTDGAVIFSTKRGEQETSLEVPFNGVQNADEAYNQALQTLHEIASAFGGIRPR
jgi:hypothetical protein